MSSRKDCCLYGVSYESHVHPTRSYGEMKHQAISRSINIMERHVYAYKGMRAHTSKFKEVNNSVEK